jgi:hypothetical protein
VRIAEAYPTFPVDFWRGPKRRRGKTVSLWTQNRSVVLLSSQIHRFTMPWSPIHVAIAMNRSLTETKRIVEEDPGVIFQSNSYNETPLHEVKKAVRLRGRSLVSPSSLVSPVCIG